jgi:transposase
VGAPRGYTPKIEYNFNWKSISAIGGIDPDGKTHFRIHEGSIKKEQVIEYLEQLLRHIVDGYIVILWDGLPAHRAIAVKEFAELHRDRISIYRLPAYCPDFNPVEWLWAEVKWNRLKGYCPKNLSELRKKLISIIGVLRRKPDLIMSYFDVSALPIKPQTVRK